MSTVRALLLLSTAALFAAPVLAGAEPRLASPAAHATPAPETTTAPAGTTSPAAVPVTPLVAAPAAVHAAERTGAAFPAAGSQAVDVGWAATRLGLACAVVGMLLIGGLKLYRRAMQPGRRAAGRRSGGWLARWGAAKPGDEDRITLLARSYLGTRESVCILRVGSERFLVGVTSAQISMLGRLSVGESTETAPVAQDRRRASIRAAAAAPRLSNGVAANGPSDLLESLASVRPVNESADEPSQLFDSPAATRSGATPDFSESLMAAASARDGGGDADLRQALARSRARLAEIVSGRSSGA